MPCFKLAEYFLTNFKGNGPQRIKYLTLATNPFRISYYGKEIVISKYNFFKKLKKNHLAKLIHAQERTRVLEEKQEVDDTFKIAKTIVH